MITKEQGKTLDKLVQFLANIADAWDAASQEQRKKIARCLFKDVIAVRPQLELKPFFDLNHKAMEEKLSRSFLKWRPRGDSNPRSPP